MPQLQLREGFGRAVILPSVAAVMLLAIAIGAVLHFSTRQSDTLALERQNRLVAVALQQSMTAIANDQEASTLWEAAVRLRERPLDYEWIDNNFGIWFHSFYGHDETYLLDPTGSAIYAMQAGVRSQPRTFRRLAPQVHHLVTDIRQTLRPGHLAQTAAADQAVGSSDVVVIRGRPAIVSIKPIVSGTREIAQEPGSEYLHVSLRYLDASFIEQLSLNYGIDDLRFSSQAAGKASLPIEDKDGNAIGYFVWSPFEPGEHVGDRMAPIIALALLLIGCVLSWLLSRNWRSRLELEASRAQAHHLAFHDPLTGLPNRALFDDRLTHAIGRARRGMGLSVLLLDLGSGPIKLLAEGAIG